LYGARTAALPVRLTITMWSKSSYASDGEAGSPGAVVKLTPGSASYSQIS
jgi:hypothetical protein